jgi:hypothetical protein
MKLWVARLPFVPDASQSDGLSAVGKAALFQLLICQILKDQNFVDELRKKMWKEEKINYRHVLEIKKYIEEYLKGNYSVEKFVSMFGQNIEDYA